MTTTSRVSAPRESLIAAISPAPPGMVPRKAVATSSRVCRDSSQPLNKLRTRMMTTAKTKTHGCLGRISRFDGEKPAPRAVPMTACAPR